MLEIARRLRSAQISWPEKHQAWQCAAAWEWRFNRLIWRLWYLTVMLCVITSILSFSKKNVRMLNCKKKEYWSERWWGCESISISISPYASYPNKPFPATSCEETKDFCRWLLDMSPERRPSDASKALTHPFLRGWVRLFIVEANPEGCELPELELECCWKKRLEKKHKMQPNTTASNSVHGIVFFDLLNQ